MRWEGGLEGVVVMETYLTFYDANMFGMTPWTGERGWEVRETSQSYWRRRGQTVVRGVVHTPEQLKGQLSTALREGVELRSFNSGFESVQGARCHGVGWQGIPIPDGLWEECVLPIVCPSSNLF